MSKSNSSNKPEVNESEVVKTESKKEMTPEELKEYKAKKKQERLRAQKSRDVLALDDKYVKPGKKYRLCNLTPGNIEARKADGWTMVEGPIHVGDGSLQNPKTAKGCVEVTVGKVTDLKAVWMETDEENYEILREIEADKAKAQMAQVDASEIPEESQYNNKIKVSK